LNPFALRRLQGEIIGQAIALVTEIGKSGNSRVAEWFQPDFEMGRYFVEFAALVGPAKIPVHGTGVAQGVQRGVEGMGENRIRIRREVAQALSGGRLPCRQGMVISGFYCFWTGENPDIVQLLGQIVAKQLSGITGRNRFSPGTHRQRSKPVAV